MQTILGSGGAIAQELAKALNSYPDPVRLVSRNPRKVNETDMLFPLDLTRPGAVAEAVAGSRVVYLTIGLPYKLSVWQQQWPALMKAVIDACSREGAKLVFFDNIYMYDQEHLSHMTESTPINPGSKKGLVRKEVADLLLAAVKEGRLNALIARSADFLGPKNSILTEMVYKNLRKKKKANWIGNPDKKHSFTFTGDAARATALLGNTEDAFNQVWHLPTYRPAPSGKEWIELFARQMGASSGVSVMPNWMLSALGIFIPVLKEMKEMTYQYDRDYVFDSSKIEARFGLKPISPEEGVQKVVQQLKEEEQLNQKH